MMYRWNDGIVVTDFSGQTVFIAVRYSVSINTLPKTINFVSQRNLVNDNCV
jgi:hypothetical protein